MSDEANAMAALERAIRNQKAPIDVGRLFFWAGDHVLTLVMLKPCKCGVPLAEASFAAGSRVDAIRQARAFVEGLATEAEDE
jgi:hypothetical protein